MDLTHLLLLALGALFVLLALGRLLRAPLRLAVKLLCNTALGFAALWAVQLAAPFTGIVLGLNLFNALVIAILGLPGFLLLLLVQWAL